MTAMSPDVDVEPAGALGWTPAELAALFGVHVSWVRQKIAAGTIPVIEVGPRRRYVPREWVTENYLSHQPR